MSKYTFSIENDLSGNFNRVNLINEFIDTSLYANLKSLYSTNDDLKINFRTTITSGDESLLNSLISNHDHNKQINNYYNFIIDENLSSTTSTDYQRKITMVTEYLRAGEYIISWNFNWRINKINSNAFFEIKVDDTNVLEEFSTDNYKNNILDDKLSHTSFTKIYLNKGIHTIDMNFKRSNNIKSTVFIWNAKLEINSLSNLIN